MISYASSQQSLAMPCQSVILQCTGTSLSQQSQIEDLLKEQKCENFMLNFFILGVRSLGRFLKLWYPKDKDRAVSDATILLNVHHNEQP